MKDFLKEFDNKIKCSQTIFDKLENFEKELNNKINNINNEKEDSSPYLVKLSLRYSLNNLYKKRSLYEKQLNKNKNKKKNKKDKKEEEDDNDYQNEINENIKNINKLIKE